MRDREFKQITVTSALCLIVAFFTFSSCGKKNEAGTPETPITGIGFQQSNLLATFDPSFESADLGNNGPIGRPSRPSRPSIPVGPNNHFRVTGGARRGVVDHEVTSIAARSGQKSLRLYVGNRQTLIMPISTRLKESPLRVISGARYRFQVSVRFPRGIISSPRGTVEAQFNEGLNPAGRARTTLASSQIDNSGWYTLSGEFEVPSLVNNAKLLIQINGSDDLLIDDLSLIRIR